LANEKIDAVVLAGSAAVAFGGLAGAASVAGISAINQIGNHVIAQIDGDGVGGIHVGSVILSAEDSSSINAVGGAASIAASFAGTGAASLSVGVALAENSINNRVQASITHAHDLHASAGNVIVSAIEANRIAADTVAASAAIAIAPVGIAISGGLASAFNTIESITTAFIADSAHIQASGAVQVTAVDTATIDADIKSISAAGGVISVAVGLGLTHNKAQNTVSSSIRNSKVIAEGGDIEVSADSNPIIETKIEATALSIGFGVGMAGVRSISEIAVNTESYLDSAQLSAVGHDILVTATSTSIAAPVTNGNAGGLIAVSLLDAQAIIAGHTLAYVQGTGTITADKLAVSAIDTNEATPVANIVAGGAIEVTLATTNIVLERETTAQIRAGANLTLASGGSLEVSATSTSTSTGTMNSSGGGAVDLTFLTVDSSINSLTQAVIEAGANISVTGGNVDVTASATNKANATTNSTSIGAVTFGTSDPTATITATTEALAMGNITGTDGAPGAVNVRVTADGDDATTAGAKALGIGLVTVGNSTVIAQTSPTVTALAGGVIHATGDVQIQSTSIGDADAATETVAGGAVAVTDLDASATAVTNVTSDVVAGTVITAGGDITISASHGQLPPPTSDGSFDAASDVDQNTNTIDFGLLAHGLLTGDTVTYDVKGGVAIGGLQAGQTYGVIKTSDTTLQLGASFQSVINAGQWQEQILLDTATDTIGFTAPHNLHDDDLVVYQADGAAVGGLNDGVTYQVVVIDATHIKLIDPASMPAPARDFSGAAIAGDSINMDGHGFTEGQALTYRSPDAVEFGLPSVDVAGGVYDANSPSTNTAQVDANDNIYLGPDHGLVSGDEVIYRAQNGEPIIGLTSGERYFVIFDPSKPNEIQLAETLGQAMGSAEDASTDPVTPAVSPEAIELSRSALSADESTSLSVRKVTDQAIGGLVDGVTYFAVQVVANTSFKLATDKLGTNIVTPGGIDPVTGETVLSGSSTLGSEGVDLSNPGSGAHRLVLDFNSVGSGIQLLDGVGGARALTGAPSGDGIVTASASGLGGGFVSSSNALTKSTNTPTVITRIGDGAILGGNNIIITAESLGNASASSINGGGGLVSIGDAESHLDINSTGRVEIGSAALTAGHDITLRSSTSVDGTVLAGSVGGGLFDFADADVSAVINYESTVDIGASADLRAAHRVTVDSVSMTMASAGAIGDSKGLSSSADTSALLVIGTVDDRAITQTLLGEGARLQADEVIVRARVSNMLASVNAKAGSGGAVADAKAEAGLAVFDGVRVDLADNAAITGETVTISADHDRVVLSSISNADADGLYGNASSIAGADYNSLNIITTEPAVTVAAGELTVSATRQAPDIAHFAFADILHFGTANALVQGNESANSIINWNGNVTFLATPTPKLEIGAIGDIVRADGITATVDANAGRVMVNSIIDTAVGNASFSADKITGSSGIVSSGASFPRVEVINRSNYDLVLSDMNLSNGTAVPNVMLDAEDVSLTFDVGNVAPAGDLDILILNEGTGDVRINGLVDNPLGLIRIENTQGGIVSNDGTNDILRGQKIELLSATGIGSVAGADILRVNAELVTSEGRTTDFNAQASDDIWLNFVGHVRDADASNSLFNAGRIETSGGNVDLLFQSTRQETTSSGVAAGVAVTVNGDGPTRYLEHFKTDTADGAALLDFRLFNDTSVFELVNGAYAFEQISGNNIKLVAASEEDDDPLVAITSYTDHSDTGQIDALFNGSIALTETAGDFRIGRVESTKGDVFLEAGHTLANLGDVASSDDGTTPSVLGRSITMLADGFIGSATDFFEIDSSVPELGQVRAIANQSVFLTETAGKLNLDGVASNHGDVSLLTLSGSILDGVVETDGDLADVQGRDIDLIARGGTLGTADNDLEIDGAGSYKQNNILQMTTGQPEDGRLYALADLGIYLKEVNASLDVLRVESLQGDVRLSVYDSLETILGTTNPLPQDLNLLAGNGTSLTGTPVLGGVIQTLNGSVLIDAGDDVNIALGTLVKAATSVTVRGDYAGVIGDERDLNIGTTITIEGDLQSPEVEIMGGADIDYIQLLGTAGINAGGDNTWLMGNASDDKFFVQGSQVALTLQGGSGADRYYLSSTAAKSVFMAEGLYNDDVLNAFDYLGGTLDGFDATVTVETSSGGEKGTRDIIYASSASSTAILNGEITDNAGDAVLSGLSMGGQIDVSVPVAETAFLMVGLGSGDDIFQIKGLGPKLIAEIFARGGSDTLDVHNDSDSLADISGVIGFHGGGDDDTLNVRGDASAPAEQLTWADPDQLTAIGITGLGMGSNPLFSTHDRFGAGYDSDLGGQYPGAIYYATRNISDGEDSFSSDVEFVNVRLGGGADSFRVDSVYDYGQTSIFGGDGDDMLSVGSTVTGLQPNDTHQVDFVYGSLLLDGEGGDNNTLIVDDSGDDKDNVGRYEGTTVYGLGMPQGSVSFANAAHVEILLGVGKDAFYVPATSAEIALTLNTGGGVDSVYVGTVAGMEDTGSLDAIQGDIMIEGQGPDTGDRLYLNDQANSNPMQSYRFHNEITGERGLTDGAMWPVDTTNFSRSGTANVLYRSMEIVVLNAGTGDDFINVESTHREQDVLGGKGSSLSINAGGGNDTINIGERVDGVYTLDSFAIDLVTPSYGSIKGIPVLVNGQGGVDSVHFLDSASSANTNLAFAQRDFAELFPASDPGDTDGASDVYAGLFHSIFGEDPQSSPYATVVLSREASASIEAVGPAVDATFRVTSDATGGTFDLHISGLTGDEVDVLDIPFDVDGLKTRIEAAAASQGQLLQVDVTRAVSGDAWDIHFLEPASGAILSVDGSRLTRESPLNVNARGTEKVLVTLGSGDDVVQLTSDQYQHDITVYGGAGDDVFNLENGVDLLGHKAVFNGNTGDDVLFANFEDGVPTTGLDIEFNGGAERPIIDDDQSLPGQSLPGDKVRIAGDGAVTGGEYRPSSTMARAGIVSLAGNQFSFTGVEPVVVHGLPDFTVVTPDVKANLAVESIAVDDLKLPNLSLQLVTIDGVISWTQETKLTVPDALEPLYLGSAVTLDAVGNPVVQAGSIAMDGDTLVVGGQLDGAGYGVVYVYDWDGSNWIESAKLYPADKGSTGAGFGFGYAVAIEGDQIIVGAPWDSSNGAYSGAGYLFERSAGSWHQTAKLIAYDAAAGDAFGISVDISGDRIVVGAPGVFADSEGLLLADAPAILGTGYIDNTSNDTVYIFKKNDSNWSHGGPITGTNSDFGRAVALDGNYLAVGAPDANGFGAVSVFQAASQNSLSWQHIDFLEPSDPDDGEEFGRAVAMDGGRIVVGAPLWDGIANDRADQGRAFVFDRVGSDYILRARLTADGGLPSVEAANEGKAGDHFGLSVALSGNYVVAGAPGYDGKPEGAGLINAVNNAGAAYVFFERPEAGSGNAPTWVRSTGDSGSGRLMVPVPAGFDPDAPLADSFGSGVAISGSRVVVGLPGYNDSQVITDPSDQFDGTVQIIRGDIGAFRTYSTDGAIPTPSNANMRAEILSSDLAGFGEITHYDEATRTLFVGAADSGTVMVYVNEGLYWRPVDMDGNADNGVQGLTQGATGSEFGTDIDTDGTWLVIGAPGENKAYVYGRSDDDWDLSPTKTLNNDADSGSGGFGTAVAVDDNVIVVGAPTASVTYYSTDPSVHYADPDPHTSAEHKVSLGSSGVVHVFKLVYSNWQRSGTLRPDDDRLEDSTFTYVAAVPESPDVGRVSFRDTGTNQYGSFFNAGTYDFINHNFAHNGTSLNKSSDAMIIAPRTAVTISSTGYDPDYTTYLENTSYTPSASIQFVNGSYLTLNDGTEV
jgi:hypothetical protein